MTQLLDTPKHFRGLLVVSDLKDLTDDTLLAEAGTEEDGPVSVAVAPRYVTQFRNSKGQLVGQIGPTFWSPLDVALALYRAHWRKKDLPVALAVFKAESSLSPEAKGDIQRAGEETEDGRHWGASIGIAQMRSISEDQGTGTAYDKNKLYLPSFNLQVAKDMHDSRGFQPWGAFTNGAWQSYEQMAKNVCSFLGVAVS